MQTKGFTLVELIVVITILAILGTIAFISLQGYSQEAKNSKVINDVRALGTAVETSLTSGSVNMGDLTVGDRTATNGLTDGSNFGSGATTTAWANYKVGTVNFTGLRQNGTDFKDNEGNDYIAATAIDGATNSAFYQIVGQTKNADGSYAAIVKGNYIVVNPGTDSTGLVTETGWATWVSSADVAMTTGLY